MAHGEVGEKPSCKSEHCAAQRLGHKQLAERERPDLSVRGCGCDGKQRRKQHDPDAVVEQRLAGHVRLQLGGNVDGFQRREHRNGVRRADKRAEDECPGQRQADVKDQ